MAIDLSKLSDDDLAAVQAGDMSKVSDEGLNTISSQPAESIKAPVSAKVPLTAKDILEKSKVPGTKDEVLGTPSEANVAGVVEAIPFSSRAIAAAKTAGDVLSGGGISDLSSKYAKYKEQRDLYNKAQEEASPQEYGRGQLVGNLAGAALMPEMGGAKLLGAAGKVAPGAAEFLAGQTGGLASKLAGKAAAGALEGAPVGALYGASGSKDLTNLPETAKDVLSGSAMGSLAGAGLMAAGQAGRSALSGAKELAQGSDYLQKMGAAYGYGQKGIDLASSRGQDTAALLSKHIPNQIVNNIMDVDAVMGKNVGTAIEKAQDAGTKINIDKDLYSSTQNLFSTFMDNPSLMDLIDPKSKSVIDMIYKKGPGDLTPVEAKALKDTFYDLSSKLSGLGGEVAPIAQRQGLKLAGALDQSLKSQIPEYADAAQKFYDFRSSIPETILQPGIPVDKRTVYLGDLKNKEAELFDAAKDLFSNAQMPGAAVTSGARAGLKELGQNLQTLGRTNPEAVQGLGGSPQEVYANLRDKANQLAMIKQSMGVDPHQGLNKTILGQVVGSGQGLGLNIANKVGRAVKVAGQSGPVQLGTKLYSSSNEDLLGLAQYMKESPATKLLGDSLETALQNKTDFAKNAILFRMLQDPSYRGLLKEQGFEPEENKP